MAMFKGEVKSAIFNGIDITPNIDSIDVELPEERPIIFTDDQGVTMTYTQEEWDRMTNNWATDPVDTKSGTLRDVALVGNSIIPNTYIAAGSGGIVPSAPVILTFNQGAPKTMSRSVHAELLDYLEDVLGLPIDGLTEMSIEGKVDDLGRIHLTYLTKPLAEAHAKRNPPIAKTILSADDAKPKRNDRKTSTERG